MGVPRILYDGLRELVYTYHEQYTSQFKANRAEHSLYVAQIKNLEYAVKELERRIKSNDSAIKVMNKDKCDGI